MNKKVKLTKQVDKSHYGFAHYMSKGRWSSVWHQIDEVQKLNPSNVLEIGPGGGVFKTVASIFGIEVETLDFDIALNPNYVGLATELPFSDMSFDVVCAFQVLEHMPYDDSLSAFSEMVRVCRSNVVISLPDARSVWRYLIYIPKIGAYNFLVPRPQLRAPIHRPEREHYWEVSKMNYQVSRIVRDFSRHIRLVKTYRVPEFPYHRFFVFER